MVLKLVEMMSRGKIWAYSEGNEAAGNLLFMIWNYHLCKTSEVLVCVCVIGSNDIIQAQEMW